MKVITLFTEEFCFSGQKFKPRVCLYRCCISQVCLVLKNGLTKIADKNNNWSYV